MVVRGFSGDDHVVDVAFAEASVGDSDKSCFGLQLGDGGAAEVAHARFEATDELVDHGFEWSAVGYAAFDAFGDEFGEAVGA